MVNALEIAKKYFNVVEKDPGEYKTVKGGMMKAECKQYYIEGLGNMAFQNATAMFGLMKMDMMCITPIERDLPLFSYDIINAMGNYTLIIEMYDVMLENGTFMASDLPEFLEIKDKYKDLPDDDRGEHWYDSIKLTSSVSKKGKKKALEAQCDELYAAYLEKYFKMAKEMSPCNADEKREKSHSYVDGLLSNGGPSTDQFIKLIGKEKTEEYFTKVIFGTK